MRRILSAAAALILAFGAALLGATAAGADGSFTSTGMPGDVYPGESFTVGGTLPAGDTLTSISIVTPAGSSGPGTTLTTSGDSCFTDTSANDRAWSCGATLPSNITVGDQYDEVSHYIDGGGLAQTTTSTFTVDAIPSPTISVVSDASGTSANGTAVGTNAGQPDNGEVDIHTLPDGAAAGGCDFGGTPFGCSATSTGTGLHVAVVRQDFSNPVADPFGTAIYYTVPSAPTISSGGWDGETGQVTVTGNGTVGDTVEVYSEGNTVCGTTVTDGGDGAGIWSCTSDGPISGDHIYYAYQVDTLQASDYSTDDVPTGADYQTGSYSASSLGDEEGSVDVGDNAKPTATYEFSPAGVRVSPTATDGATSVTVQVLESIEGTWQPESDCEANSACSVSGLDGDAVYEVLVTQTYPDGSTTTLTQYFFVPAAPDAPAAVDNGDLTAQLSGNADPGDQVSVYQVEADTDTLACSDTVGSESTAWDCTGPTEETSGQYGFQAAVSNDTEGAEDVPDADLYVAGAISPLSGETDIDLSQPAIPELPTIGYQYLPGGIVITGTPTGSATNVDIQFFGWNHEAEDPFPTAGTCPMNDGTVVCTITGLAPGVYNPYSNQNSGDDDDGEGEGDSNHVDDYFVVPTAPTVGEANLHSNKTATVTGTGVAGDEVIVVSGAVSAPVCETVVSASGLWSCTTSALPVTTQRISAFQEDLGAGRDDTILIDDDSIVYQPGGLSALSDGSTVITVPGTTPATTPALTIPTWSFDITGLDLNNIHPGDTFTITGSGPAGATIEAELHSTPVTIGTTTVGSDGTFSLTGVIPADTPAGAHHIVVTMTGTGLTPTTNDKAITVVTPAAGGKIITTDPSKAADSKTPTSHIVHIDPADPTAPNILTRSINPIQDVISHPAKIGAALAIGLVLLIFATLPARLLNATIAENYENLVRRVPRLGRRPRWFERLSGWLKRTPIAGAVILSAVTAFLFGFADPNFGFTLASLRLIMGLAIALFMVEYLANALTGRLIHKAWSLTVQLNIRPLGIVLTIVGVIASRLLHFSPGFLIGLVLGLVLTGTRAEEDAWKAVLVRSSVVLGFGLIAWLGYSALTTGDGGSETFWNQLFVETLVAITTEGIVAILVELLPFRLLEGERIWHRSRILWAVLYTLIIAAFVIAVVPWEGNWATLGSSLWVWIVVVAAFAVVCLAIYFYFRFWNPFHESEADGRSEPVDIGAGG